MLLQAATPALKLHFFIKKMRELNRKTLVADMHRRVKNGAAAGKQCWALDAETDIGNAVLLREIINPVEKRIDRVKHLVSRAGN